MENENLYQVLIVDDHKSNIDLLYEILKREYEITVAMNGREAIQSAVADPPDLILLDVMMPGMDGYEVCRQLKENFVTTHIPIIFVTALNEVEDESKGFQYGAVDYITKPINPMIVKARVKTHLALYDQNRQLERKVRERTKELEDTRLEIIRQLGRAAEFKDNNTGLHVIRMSHYSKWIAQQAGLSEEFVTLIFQASPMHDVGKIGIPDVVLRKPGKLNDEEWRIMQRHVEFGVEIIGEQKSDLLRMAREIVLSHHERWDGKGYPKGLAGTDIAVSGRIVAIADVFDALTDERPYKSAWKFDEAVAYISNGGNEQFDASFVNAFIQALPLIKQTYEQFSEKKQD